jgi:hypothetical protein
MQSFFCTRRSDPKDMNAGKKTVYIQQTVKTKVGKTVKFPILLAAITRQTTEFCLPN